MSPRGPRSPSWTGIAAAVALASSACATARPPPPPAADEVRFGTGDTVEVTPLDRELAGRNAEELMAVGRAAVAAGDDRRAAAAYGRVVDLFPSSPQAPEARLAAARAEARRGDWEASLARARPATGDPGVGVEASFLAASAEWHLGDLAGARLDLRSLLARPDLSPAARLRALAELGVVELDRGDAEAARRALDEAVALWAARPAAERLDRRHAAQAYYTLGEIDRRAAAAVPIDPARATPEELEAALERASTLILAAQAHYLDAIRTGDAEWGVAAGHRVGEMYAELRDRLIAAPLPPGLDAAAVRAYRAELRTATRVLLEKAVAAYDQTLAAARLAGMQGAQVEELRGALERARAALVADDAG